MLAGAVLKVRPFQETVSPDSLIEVDSIEIVVPVEAHPQKGLGCLVIDVDRSRVRAMRDALQEDQTAIDFDQAFRSGFSRFQKGGKDLPPRGARCDAWKGVGREKVVDTELAKQLPFGIASLRLHGKVLVSGGFGQRLPGGEVLEERFPVASHSALPGCL
jgi:hypothetical protein